MSGYFIYPLACLVVHLYQPESAKFLLCFHRLSGLGSLLNAVSPTVIVSYYTDCDTTVRMFMVSTKIHSRGTEVTEGRIMFFKLSVMQNLNASESNHLGPFLITGFFCVFILDACEDLDMSFPKRVFVQKRSSDHISKRP